MVTTCLFKKRKDSIYSRSNYMMGRLLDFKKLPTFEGLNVSSKFAICGLPIRLDTYKTCSFNCQYCFSNNRKIMEFKKDLQVANIKSISDRLYRIFNEGIIKDDNLLDKLIEHRITWHCGGMSDPFQPINNDLKVTNDIINITNEYGISILFSTKSDTVHDANIKPSLHTFQLSVTNVNDDRNIEPNVPSINNRVKFFNELKKEGFKVGIRIQPCIPNVSTLDIVKMFEGADHFTIEGIKVVPQNLEQKEYIFNTLKLKKEDFSQKGLLTLKADIRKEMYKPFIEYFENNNINYSISDNDLRYLSNSMCCCGDSLVQNATTFNTTAMLLKYGKNYSIDEVFTELRPYNICNCKCKHLFTSNRTNGCTTVEDFYKERFDKKKSPFSPLFQV